MNINRCRLLPLSVYERVLCVSVSMCVCVSACVFDFMPTCPCVVLICMCSICIIFFIHIHNRQTSCRVSPRISQSKISNFLSFRLRGFSVFTSLPHQRKALCAYGTCSLTRAVRYVLTHTRILTLTHTYTRKHTRSHTRQCLNRNGG